MNSSRGCAVGGGTDLHRAAAVKVTLPEKEPLPVPQSARRLQRSIAGLLKALAARDRRSCLEPDFRKQWSDILKMVDRYQQEIAAFSHKKSACAAGCAACCSHWVEDVNSFEAEIIADHLMRLFPDRIGRIVEQCRGDERRLERLNEIVEKKIVPSRPGGGGKEVDQVDVLLASFYRLRIPCPLLDRNKCLVYEVRPLTCRMYVSFSDPAHCDPERIDAGDVPTYLFDCEEEIDGIIDQLHFRFMKFAGNTGLRSLLPEYLRQHK